MSQSEVVTLPHRLFLSICHNRIDFFNFCFPNTTLQLMHCVRALVTSLTTTQFIIILCCVISIVGLSKAHCIVDKRCRRRKGHMLQPILISDE